jgi:hypothetical protein
LICWADLGNSSPLEAILKLKHCLVFLLRCHLMLSMRGFRASVEPRLDLRLASLDVADGIEMMVSLTITRSLITQRLCTVVHRTGDAAHRDAVMNSCGYLIYMNI